MAAHIKKRQVIGYNIGLVDENYIEKDGGTPEGQPNTVVSDEIVRFAQLARRILIDGGARLAPEDRIATAAARQYRITPWG